MLTEKTLWKLMQVDNYMAAYNAFCIQTMKIEKCFQ